MSTNNTPNRLTFEKSPYLLQHAYNPVDWYPWGEEAFDKAKRENKPVMVSIGYSTCHWCHVMERESFEDEEVAELLNEKFVAIKVDREERPDIDAIYMKVCQALTGQGGWPLNVFVTPDQKPFYAGTYFPKFSRYGRPGIMDVLTQLSEQYEQDHEKIVRVSHNIVEALSNKESSQGKLDSEILETCFQNFSRSFDEQYGGFGGAPKFPSPHQLMYLLRYHKWKGDDDALAMVIRSLDAMADGGIYDHIGYGFSRYSVDEKWLVPHFEKMLYDNAMLIMAYTEAYQLIKNERYKKIVNQIVTYITRDMLDPLGGFYSAEDADSEGEEGKFYLWDPDEVYAILGDDLGEVFCEAYDISRTGNFEGKSIPNRIGKPLQQVAEEQGLTQEELEKKLETAREKLFVEREKRIHPHKDDKILTSWNGLMIAALAKAGKVLNDEASVQLAKNTVDFIEHYMVVDGKLMARYRDGEVKYDGYLDDHAFYIWGLDALYEATLDENYLIKAKNYLDKMLTLFWDQKNGGFFLNQHNGEELILRPKELYDGAIPSGNSVAALMLLHLSRRTGEVSYEDQLNQMLHGFGQDVEHYPPGYSFFLQVMMLSEMDTKELVIIHGENKDEFIEAITKLNDVFLPEVFIIAGTKEELKIIAPYTASYTTLNNQTTYYLCQHYQCDTPKTDFALIERNLL